MSANIIVKRCALTALLVTLVTVVTGKNIKRLECVDSLNMPAMLEYISNNNEGSYFDEKERAQSVLDQLHQRLDERLEARIKSYTIEYKQYMDESSDEYHPIKGERLPEVIKMVRDSHEYWKKHIRDEHSLVYEDSIGGTGAYYWANLWEIEQLVKELGGTIKSLLKPKIMRQRGIFVMKSSRSTAYNCGFEQYQIICQRWQHVCCCYAEERWRTHLSRTYRGRQSINPR